MFFGDWLQRREMLSPNKVALIDALINDAALRVLLYSQECASAEIEDVMHSHPAIAEAALIPVPDPKWGEVGRAIVVLKPAASLTAADLTAWLPERMAHYKAPKSVVFVDVLPKTGSSKMGKP